jgi:hypothetical protein
MGIKTFAHNEPPGDSRYEIYLTRFPDALLKNFWMLLITATALSALANMFLIFVVSRSARLRASSFNVFVAGLALTDFLFSASCLTTCFLNYVHGVYFGGSIMCDLQGFYCIFGIASSIWLNVLITRELRRMVVCTHNLKTFHALPPKAVARRIATLYAGTALFAFAAIHVVPPFAVRGWACLTAERNVATSVKQWLFVLNGTVILPVGLIAVDFFRTARLLGWKVDVVADRAVVVFFGRLFLVFVVMWVPAILFLFGFVWADRVGQFLLPIGGTWSHLQGVVSALLCLRKEDIAAEVRPALRGVCRRGRVFRGLRRASSVLAYVDLGSLSTPKPAAASAAVFPLLASEADKASAMAQLSRDALARARRPRRAGPRLRACTR